METFSTSDAEAWEAFVGRGHYPLAVSAIGADFDASARRVDLSRSVHVSEMRVGESTLVRSRRLIKAFPSDDLLLLLQLSGSARIEQGDQRLELQAGWATWFDPTTPYSIANQTGHQVVVTIPRRDVLAPRETTTGLRLRPLPLSLAPLRVFRLLAEEVVSSGLLDERHELDGVAAAAIELLRSTAATASGRTAQAVPLALASVARAHIKDNIHDPALTVEAVAAALHVSARHLTTSFGQDDTPGAFIHRTRLELARSELLDPGHRHRTVADIASGWGYTSASAFTRAFQRRYGEPPSALRVR